MHTERSRVSEKHTSETAIATTTFTFASPALSQILFELFGDILSVFFFSLGRRLARQRGLTAGARCKSHSNRGQSGRFSICAFRECFPPFMDPAPEGSRRERNQLPQVDKTVPTKVRDGFLRPRRIKSAMAVQIKRHSARIVSRR